VQSLNRVAQDKLSHANIYRPIVSFVLAVHTYHDALARAETYQQNEDWVRWHYLQRLIATANGRYNFRQPNLNEALTQVGLMTTPPMNFRQWVEAVWGPAV
jgi:hypothetical protein